MDDTEIADILGQIRNRTIISLYLLETGAPDKVRHCICTLLEDIHEDCTALVESTCVVPTDS